METKRVREGLAPFKEMEKEINLRSVYNTLRKRWWIIVLLTGLLTGLGYLYNSRPEPPVYAASTRVIIAASNDMMSTVRALVREPIVLTQVAEKLGLEMSIGHIRSQIRVDSVDASLITVISVIDTDPQRAADIANTTIEVYRQVASDTLGVQGIRLLTPAQPDPFPINATSDTIVYVALVIGLILSVSLAFLLESLDESIRTEQDIESRLGLNMLGQVSSIKHRHVSISTRKLKTGMIRSETIGS